MNKLLLFVLLLPAGCLAQKTYMFIEGGADFYQYRPRQFAGPLFSTTFDYIVTPQLSIGGGLELNSFSAYNPYTSGYSGGLTLGLSPLIDARYFLTVGNGLLFPVLQAGYNLYKSTTQSNNTEPAITTTGGFQYAAGMGYVFKIFKKDRGLTLSLRYMNRHFDVTTPSSSTGKSGFSVSGFAPAVGIKF